MTEHIRNNFYDNLYDFHAPFQIDGNFGHAAGVAECLLQSHQRIEGKGTNASPWIIELLPALPSPWPSGTVKGLRARGGFELDITWQDGQVRHVKIHSLQGKDFVMRWDAASTRSFSLGAGQSLEINLAAE